MKKTTLKPAILFLPILIKGKAPYVMLVDDDEDDCANFLEALHDVSPEIKVRTENDGAKLMHSLRESDALPDILFLDLNMPRKNGFECLEEIRKQDKFNSTPVVIYSTSSNPDLINRTYDKGANLYLQKPQSFRDIKKALQKILLMERDDYFPQPAKSKFVLK